MVEVDFTTVKNRTLEANIIHNNNKQTDITDITIRWANKTKIRVVVPLISKVLNQKLASLSRKFPEFIPGEYLTNVHPSVKYLFTGKISNLHLTGRLAHFSKNREK